MADQDRATVPPARTWEFRLEGWEQPCACTPFFRPANRKMIKVRIRNTGALIDLDKVYMIVTVIGESIGLEKMNVHHYIAYNGICYRDMEFFIRLLLRSDGFQTHRYGAANGARWINPEKQSPAL